MNYNYLQLIVGVLSVVSLVFGAKGKYIMWPLQIVCAFLNILVYYHYHLYAKAILSVIAIFVTIYGMYKWFVIPNRAGNRLHISMFSNSARGVLFLVGLLATVLLGSFLSAYTDADFAYVDSFCASFTLMAKWMLSNKKIESWPLLVIVDIVYVGLCMYKEMYFLALK
jgi:nicotinamide mononucleotide transporter